MSQLDELRDEIRLTDEKILKMVAKRTQLAQRIGRVKREQGEPLQNFAVEKTVLDHALAFASSVDVDEETVRTIVRAVIRAAIGVQESERIRSAGATAKAALVVGGAGLMGGWFARFLSEQGMTVRVSDPKPHEWPPGRPGSVAYDVVVIATPPSVYDSVLKELEPTLAPDTLVFDISSIKGPGRTRLEAMAAKELQVASVHPMFGPDTKVLMDQNVLLLDCGNPKAVAAADALFSQTTARRRTLPLARHDELMADVLGLAHATSLLFNRALATGPNDYRTLSGLASTTFARQVDVARDVASENPSLYYEIQALNPSGPQILKRLREALTELTHIIESKDADAFINFMRAGRDYYQGGASH